MFVQKSLDKFISMNPYYEFLAKLLKDERISINGFAQKYDFPSFTVIMNKLKRDPEKKLHVETISKIEEALRIKIDDSDPENITYSKTTETFDKDIPGAIRAITPKFNSFPVVSKVRAGVPNGIREEDVIDYVAFNYPQKHSCAALMVEGDSMEEELRHGDYVLIDKEAEVQNGNIVVAVFETQEHTVKKFRYLTNELIELIPLNKKYNSLIIKRSEIAGLYRVVRSLRNH